MKLDFNVIVRRQNVCNCYNDFSIVQGFQRYRKDENLKCISSIKYSQMGKNSVGV